jgi:hypothetical protein
LVLVTEPAMETDSGLAWVLVMGLEPAWVLVMGLVPVPAVHNQNPRLILTGLKLC